MKRKTMFLQLTKTKKVAIWERGGMSETTGAAIVVARADGSRKNSIAVNSIPNGRHALILVNQNDIIVTVKYIDYMYKISIYRIQTINVETRRASMLEIATFDNLKWDDEIVAQTYSQVVEQAKKLATTKYCVEPVYCKYIKN